MHDPQLTSGRARVIAARRLLSRGYQPWPCYATKPRGYQGYWSTFKDALMLRHSSEWPAWVYREREKVVLYSEDANSVEVLTGSISTLTVVRTWGFAAEVEAALPETPLILRNGGDAYRFYLHYGDDIRTHYYSSGGIAFNILGNGGTVRLPAEDLGQIISWPSVKELPAFGLGMLGALDPRRMPAARLEGDGWR